MGFSAGGFLTRSVIANAGEEMPAFAAPIYPNMAAMTVPANAPPMFVAIAAGRFPAQAREGLAPGRKLPRGGQADRVPPDRQWRPRLRWAAPGTASEGWIELFHRWLGDRGFLAPAKP